MPDDRKRPSFWETLPGIITAVAMLIGAVAALITALYGAKVIGQDDPGKVTAKSVQESTVRKSGGKKTTETAPAVSSQVATQPVSATKIDHSVPKKGDTMTDKTTGMEFVLIPEGCFMMGAPPDEKDREDDEGPVHEICVDGFYMGKYEVTQGQWQKIMGNNPASFKKGDKYPVENVSWNDALKFLTELNGKSGKNYRLPTEAEWEYAVRAGTNTARYWGDDIDCDKAMYGNHKKMGGSCMTFVVAI
ncbi:MAG: formylglycine-generating enzyme family protein, partial [Candidatus Electrothrix sp. ATG2]|nr:formylglycine-generating enzyme family protein [Candidatus Electrothrix sp. ATG2]